MTDYSRNIIDSFENNGLSQLLNAPSVERFNILIERMLTVNQSMNLTAITNADDIILKHIADSATIVSRVPQNAKLLDVGTGAGFPALPVAILRPDVSVYALDSTLKKLKYIDETAELLGLTNIKTVNGRAEELGRSVNYRERFDVVTARAVSALNILSELCVPFVKVGGQFVAMKGSSADEELVGAKSGIAQLGGTKFEDVALVLKSDDGELQRHLLISKKTKITPPSFPRMYNRISKKPL